MFVVDGSDFLVKVWYVFGLGSSWFVLVIFLNDSRASTLFRFRIHYSFSVTSSSLGFFLLYSSENKLHIYVPNLLFVLMYVLVSADLSLHLARLLYPSVVTRRCLGGVFVEKGVMQGREHPHQGCNTTDCLEYRRHNYNF
jgi:hypothetical protein